MRAGLEVVGAVLVRRHPGCDEAVKRRHQRGGAVDHRRIDDLAQPGLSRFEDPAYEPKGDV